jgi:hypothetical protein
VSTAGCEKAASAKKLAKLTPAQEAAATDYASLLERQIDLVEQTATVLATVKDDRASRDAAQTKLLLLSLEAEAANKRATARKPAAANVVQAAQNRVQERQQQAALKLREQVRRINAMPGGEDFFQKELRQLLEGYSDASQKR